MDRYLKIICALNDAKIRGRDQINKDLKEIEIYEAEKILKNEKDSCIEIWLWYPDLQLFKQKIGLLRYSNGNFSMDYSPPWGGEYKYSYKTLYEIIDWIKSNYKAFGFPQPTNIGGYTGVPVFLLKSHCLKSN